VFTLGPMTQATLVKVKWRRIWREWGGKKKSKNSQFSSPPKTKKKGESYRMKDFLNFILAFVPNFTQKTKKN